MIITMAVGALGVSVCLALGTYLSARHYLVDQRERSALRQAFTDAARVRDGLRTSGTRVSDVLGDIALPSGTIVYVHRGGRWYSSSMEGSADQMTRRLAPVMNARSAALAWTEQAGTPAVIVGVPLREVDADYYEVASAQELARTLTTLRIVLTVGAALTTAGGVLLGLAASRRMLRPLGDVTTAAARISIGELATRLEPTDDPDLVMLVGAFNNMVDTLEERIERDARFAADVSHELRTPLTTLTTSLSLLRSASDLSPRSRQAVELMAVELDRFSRALEDLLLLGRLENGGRSDERTCSSPRELVLQSLELSERPRSLFHEDDGADPPLLVNRQQMLRALFNLYQNADIHGNGVVSVRTVRRGDRIDVHVEDDGPGVDPEDQERIFDRFARAGARKSGTGTGLGLSIVRQTLHNHGGAVWCHNRRGGGADFVLSLPIHHHSAGEGHGKEVSSA